MIPASTTAANNMIRVSGNCSNVQPNPGRRFIDAMAIRSLQNDAQA
jgi:hypothetical protein